VYASYTHCTSEIVAPIVACNAGSAMFTTVASIIAMLEPRMVAVRICFDARMFRNNRLNPARAWYSSNGWNFSGSSRQ